MQIGGVDQPGHQRPGLLGVPGPIAAPGPLSPDGAGDNGEGEKQQPQRYASIAQHVQLLPGGDVLVQEPACLHFLPQQEDDPQHTGHAEGPVGDDGRGHVEPQPVGLEGGHQGADLLGLQCRIADDEEGDRRGEGAQDREFELQNEQQAHQAQTPGEGRGELVLVA